MLAVCSPAEDADGAMVDIGPPSRGSTDCSMTSETRVPGAGAGLQKHWESSKIAKERRKGDEYLGLLVLFDPAQTWTGEDLGGAQALGVDLKVITGDNR